MNRPPLPRIVALAPADLAGVGLAASACRAGALGMLDLARVGLSRDAIEALTLLDRRAATPFAIRVEATDLSDEILAHLPVHLTAIALVNGVSGPDDAADATIARVRRAGRVAWREVSSRAEADRAVAAGAEGLILAGHEAGGFGSDESSFVLAQGVAARHDVPAWVRGGIGPRSAAGCVAAGAAGVVLDGALLLARESPLESKARDRVARWDGGETVVVGPHGGRRVRVFAPPGSAVLDRLRSATADDWADVVATSVGWDDGQAWPVGQDAAFAADLARRTGTAVGAIVREVDRAIDAGIGQAHSGRTLAAGSPLAASLGTTYPILQGPMTRVSDVVPFAEAVAAGGALPFLALAMLRGKALTDLLGQATATLRGRPWGVGLLGFNEPDLRREQMAEVIEARPPFALLAGGRPDQARELERAGIPTFLHAPSPGLLTQFVRDGARRFILEGRECGGHVGPRSSLVLWEQAVGVLLDAVAKGTPADEIQLVLAGGIHDDRSAAAAAAVAAPLAQLGAKVGVLVGTAYLFTEEAVRTGAIVARYQDEALRCGSTVLLETGPGHEIRVGPSPFVAAFDAERRRLAESGAKSEAIREALERLNAGRLRIATKGLDRGDGGPLVAVADADQFERGTYMIGQVAALRGEVTTIAALHRSISDGSALWLDRIATSKTPEVTASRPSDVAIVGMSAILPGAGDVRTFWENTLAGTDAITEIPADRWDWRLYYDADPKAPDKIVSKWGGFVPDVRFDPLRYGMPPASLPSIEPVQLLLLEATRAAIADAGYADRPFARERTAVVLGMGGGAAQLAMGYAFRSYLPMLDTVRPGAGDDALAACDGLLPEWTEDSFPGFLLNVAAGRVANRFDLGGSNYTVDAACGSSLAAANLAVRELETGAADVVILGGADTVQNPFTYLAFSKTQAFSPRGRCRPFDASADGIVISEGVSVLVLKRLADAERDGDRIYAVIKGVGASSDGRARGLTAPSPDGQVRAVRRAYEKAGVSPTSVGYVEAHGTGTAVGDVVEVNSVAKVFREAGAAPASTAIGSVKSQIGHTKCAAGLAGLINATLALHHGVIPPTIGVETVNPKADLADGPFRVNTKARPWVHADADTPRRAGVSAFGFGGTNFHAVLEAYDRGAATTTAPVRRWPAELFTWRDADRAKLGAQLDALLAGIDRGARPPLPDLSRAINASAANRPAGGPTLAIVATDLDDLATKLRSVRKAIGSEAPGLDDPRGIFFAARPQFAGSPVAFLFPGQGSQSVGMLADVARTFPEVRAAFDETDAALVRLGRTPVGPEVFPVGDGPADALTPSALAQPALGAAAVGLLRLLRTLGVEPDLVGGHSYGELVALHAAGSLTVDGLAALGEARGRWMGECLGTEPGSMAAIAAGTGDVTGLIDGLTGVIVANSNGPRQTVVAGPRAGVELAVRRAEGRGLRARALPVAGAFHTPALGDASPRLADLAGALVVGPPDRPVYSNLDAAPHPADPRQIAARLGDHVARPVEFAAMVGAMHDRGARVFVEVGPAAVLTPLVGSILGDRPHLAIACDAAGKPGLPTLLTAMARLVAAGVAVRLDRLTLGRTDPTLAVDPARLPVGDGRPAPSATTWLVNGSRSRPLGQPEPRRLGQGPVLPVPINGVAKPKAEPPATPAPAPTPVLDLPRRNGWHPPHTAPSDLSRNGTTMNPTPSPNAAPPRAPAVPATGGDDRVMAAFQETMRAFLDVQRSTMLAYLQARPGSAGVSQVIPLVQAPAVIAAPVPPPTPVPMPPAAPARVVVAEPAPAPLPAPIAKPEPAPVVAAAVLGRDAIAARLQEIVRDRTGYPIEMLDLGLDLEADLGIDSIKRVEILGTLRDTVPALAGANDGATMDALSRARTLGAIVDKVEQVARKLDIPTPMPALAPAQAAVARPSEPAAEPDHEVRRLVLEAVPTGPFTGPAGLPPGGVVVVTDDGRGIARGVAARLEADGYPVEMAGTAEVDFTSPAAIDAWLGRARRLGDVAAVVHALPLRDLQPAGLDPSAWAARMGPEVRGLFLLAKAAANDLDRAAKRGGGALLAATGMGGMSGSAGQPGRGVTFFPGHGGVSGLVKTLAREWPAIRSRVVDLDPREPVNTLAGRLLEEFWAESGWTEVGYAEGARVRLQAVPSPLAGRPVAGVEIRPGEPIVLTGGARGITATIAAEIARTWRPTLLLAGRSPLPAAEEDPATRDLIAPAELKAALLAKLRRDGRPTTAADLERAFQGVTHAREIRANLDALRHAGATVEYAAVDVRDAAALGAVLDGWRSKYGDPVGLVHGAGVIKDKLIRDKAAETFDLVLGTKLDGALNLARLLRPEAIRFAALFASVAGRFGNEGQTDYAAANEVLNKLAIWLDGRWPGRVVAMNWGPWSGVGMVSDLEAHLGGRGLGMIPPEVGASLLVDELRQGRKGEVEVVAAGNLGTLDAPIEVVRPFSIKRPTARAGR